MAGRDEAARGGRASARQVARRLESLVAAGVTDLPKRGRRRPPAVTKPVTVAVGKDEQLRVLREEVAACRRCEPLARARAHTVFGSGPATARLCFLGEAPGADEDASGEPFVGRAGQLLDRMLMAVGLTRAEAAPDEQVFIANVIKCRPPGNRNPQPEEVAQCEPYLQRQIELLRPKIILAMGRFAVQSLLAQSAPEQATLPLGKLRGKVYAYRGVPVVVTYHPAYLLRSPGEKAKAWADLCLAMAHLRGRGATD